jgi:hypothetical protein
MTRAVILITVAFGIAVVALLVAATVVLTPAIPKQSSPAPVAAYTPPTCSTVSAKLSRQAKLRRAEDCAREIEMHRQQERTSEDANRSIEAAWAAISLSREQVRSQIAATLVAFATLLAAVAAALYARSAGNAAKRSADQAVEMTTLSRLSVDAAVRSSDATLEANELAKQVSITELRPWLIVKPTLGEDVTFREGRMNFLITLDIKNVGRTPAHSIYVSGKTHNNVQSINNDYFEDFFEENMRVAGAGGILLPGEEMNYRIALSVTPNEGALRVFPALALSVSYRGRVNDDVYHTGHMMTVFFNKDQTLPISDIALNSLLPYVYPWWSRVT